LSIFVHRMNYNKAIAFLNSQFPQYQNIGAAGYKPGLERMLTLSRWLGQPQDAFRSVHVAGTNGKGSVSHMLAAVFQSLGYRTGLYTSPHLIDFRERIKIDGQMIEEEAVASFVETYIRERDLADASGVPSFFEITTAMAFRYFASKNVQVAVIEAGLGGRLDSTNVLSADALDLTVITNIGLEHCDILGHTIALIAGEKAGIMKPGVPAVIGEYDPESYPVFEARAKELDIPLFLASFNTTDNAVLTSELDLKGSYQEKNLKTVLCALDVLQKKGAFDISPFSLSKVQEGLRHAAALTGLRGRWEKLGERPAIIADTGHNAHGLRYLPVQLARESYEKLFIILGFVTGKDLEPVAPFLPSDAFYFFTQARIQRALPAASLAAWAAGKGLSGRIFPSIEEAFINARAQAGPGDLIFIGGSTFTVAEVLEKFFCRKEK
jgi:dihydrofolate synthase/folylpolyglutamate synthase